MTTAAGLFYFLQKKISRLHCFRQTSRSLRGAVFILDDSPIYASIVFDDILVEVGGAMLMFFTYELAKQQVVLKRRRWSTWMRLLMLAVILYFVFRVL